MEHIIAPSILAADFCRLGEQIKIVERGGASWIHVDVMDGLFVPNISVGLPVLRSLRRETPLTLDAHLMIDRPLRYVDAFLDAGADVLTLHIESDTPENLETGLRRIRERGKLASVSIKPKTPVTAILPYLPLLDMVLLMTVEPGFGGQSFMDGSLERIAELRSLAGERIYLQVDGGIDEHTVKPCAQAGANVFVAGSSVFGKPDPAQAVTDLLACIFV